MNKTYSLPLEKIVIKATRSSNIQNVLFRGYQYKIDGKPKYSQFLIGKLVIEEDGKESFIPNANYFEIYDKNNAPYPVDRD
ncbi:hypothetical protein CKF54_00635, partial [Psittacicella hinzii]